MQTYYKPLMAAFLASALLSGCGAVAAGTAGALVADEGINENDGKFDPLENTEIGKKIYE